MTVSGPPEGTPREIAAALPAIEAETEGATGAEIEVEIADSARARRRGLLGRAGITGALLLTPARGVHTVGMRFALDVAYLDRELRVLSVRTMRPGRVGRPRVRARHVLEAEAGAMARWGVRRGARIAVHGTE
ncbi:DUF192 domain-containing protein [Streptomyces kanamyceticus]|uniref:DUF192 domain-containing protein n=2 Tax=Streptomyces kanamyceticus TaxID=1967 RepID=A0A5J6GU53_STRKN|nr:DUF192 domain-containing protein [Streptomyces kanamyceticus]